MNSYKQVYLKLFFILVNVERPVDKDKFLKKQVNIIFACEIYRKS